MRRRTLPVRRLAVAAIAPLALTTLAACGSDEGSSATDDASPSAGSSASAEPGSSAASEVAAAVVGDAMEPDEFMKLFEGAFDGGTAHLVMASDGDVAGFQAEGDADFSKTPPDMTLSLSGAALQGQDADAVIVDGVMYIQLGISGGQFIKFDPSDPDSLLGSGLTDQLDPRAMFESFGDSITSVVHEGEQDLDGETVDAYAVTIDSEAVLAAAGQQVPSGADVPDEIVYEMFLDEDGRFRRLAFDLGESVGEVSMDLTDWGKDVTIEAPPADQVTELPAGSLPGSSASG